MDCNKDEAMRARTIAEQKMQKGDFLGAQKIALKAKQLYPELENVSQLLTVCEVHCSAQARVNGLEMDWYGILQVEKFAEEAVIKKQFRKLALALHPDKNKFSGAEAAFKLISEAQTILSDPLRRPMYDMKCKANVPAATSKPRPPSAKTSRKTLNHSQKFRPVVHDPLDSFWTLCNNCKTRYEYRREHIGKVLFCTSCRQTFVAFDLGPRWNPFTTGNAGPSNAAPKNESAFPTGMKPSFGGSKTEHFASDGNFKPDVTRAASSSKEAEANGKPEKTDLPNKKTDESKANNLDASAKAPSKRKTPLKKKVKHEDKKTEVPESKTEQVNVVSSQNSEVRKSSRKRSHVSYDESANDKDVEPPEKKTKTEDTKRNDEVLEESTMKESKQSSSEKKSDITEDENPPIKCQDNNFCDFNMHREASKFKVGQIWACFDPLDGMPRFYAYISKIFSGSFRVKFVWLETNPIREEEEKWCDAELPSACGRYSRGSSQETEDSLIFSHPITFRKEKSKYFIHAYKEEHWAVFRNWDFNWSSEPDKHQPPYQFDYVEIISEFESQKGVEVAFLKQVKGFVSVFDRADSETSFIPPHEIFRFSHRIPSHKLTGNEADGIRPGFIEFDTASLPPDISADDNLTNSPPQDESTISTPEAVKSRSANVNGTDSPRTHLVKVIDNDFSKERSMDKFEAGQVWAVFLEKKNPPRNFAVVKKCSDGKVHVSMLSTLSPRKDAVRPSCVGALKISNACKINVLDPSMFSHPVKAEMTPKKDYLIYPRTGELWAIYKDSNAASKNYDLFDFVEVLQGSASFVTALVLQQMVGHSSFFRPPLKRDTSKFTLEIPVSEFFRFSHQCFGIKHTGEKEKLLNNCWEIDPASRPGGAVLLE